MTKIESHIPVFEKTINTTHHWLHELKDLGEFEDINDAYAVLRVVLHALRDRLPTDEAVQLAAEFPMLIRGFYYEGWKPSTTPRKQRSLESFLAGIEPIPRISEGYTMDDCVSLVFKMLAHRISEGEIADVRLSMPKEVRELWPKY